MGWDLNHDTKTPSWLLDSTDFGMAFGGIALVVVGVILVLALPPPFGVVLTLAGVSLWGSQVEVPKRALKSAKETLKPPAEHEVTTKSVDVVDDPKESESKKVEEVVTEKIPDEKVAEDPAADTVDTTASTTTPFQLAEDKVEYYVQPDAEKKTKRAVSERFKNFGKKLSSRGRSDRSLGGQSDSSRSKSDDKKKSIFKRRNSDKLNLQQPKDESRSSKKWRLSFKRPSRTSTPPPIEVIAEQ